MAHSNLLRAPANFIGGYDAPAPGVARLPVYAPATGTALAEIPDSGPAEIAAAAGAARERYSWWAARTAEERGQVLLALARGIEARSADFIYTLTRDAGLPAAFARETELPAALRALRFWAARITSAEGRARAEPGRPMSYARARPRGVVGLLLPSARGLSAWAQLAAPALAAGNALVVKPGATAPLAFRLLADSLNEAGVPPGLLNLVFGSGAKTGTALVADAGIDAVAFVGRAELARSVGAAVAAEGKAFVAITGGRHATLVMEDADLAEAAIAVVRGVYAPRTEAGADSSLILLDEKIAEPFLEKFLRTTSLLKMGDPEERATQIAALPRARDLVTVRDYLTRAGGSRLGIELGQPPEAFRGGFHFSPSAYQFREVPPPCPVPAPLAAIVRFSGRRELLARATAAGLRSASLFTRDLAFAHGLAHELPAASVTLNAFSLLDEGDAFGGTHRGGIGAEELRAAFTAEQTIRIRL